MIIVNWTAGISQLLYWYLINCITGIFEIFLMNLFQHKEFYCCWNMQENKEKTNKLSKILQFKNHSHLWISQSIACNGYNNVGVWLRCWWLLLDDTASQSSISQTWLANMDFVLHLSPTSMYPLARIRIREVINHEWSIYFTEWMLRLLIFLIVMNFH